MKKNQPKRKLKLNRQTVRTLADHETANAVGGVWNAPQFDSETVDMEGCCCTHLCGTTGFTCR